MGSNDKNRLSYFADDVINSIPLPERFTFPFHYEPHPLAIIAAEDLQRYLETQAGIHPDFGLSPNIKDTATGKMFGILVVADTKGKIGYLSAFSGKLAGTNDHPKFVPPVFDMLTENSFFIKGIQSITAINRQVKQISSDENYSRLKQDLEQYAVKQSQEIAALKHQLKDNKEFRKGLRGEKKGVLDTQEHALLEADLVKQSLYDKHLLKTLQNKWEGFLADIQAKLSPFETRIEALKEERKERSAALQAQLFEQYTFLNQAGNSKSLYEIFKSTASGKPPSAAGECATPKLLQFAFSNGYTPLAMAEFWWGSSPKSEIRKHKQFYPACTNKCKPILAYMLQGMQVDENPFNE